MIISLVGSHGTGKTSVSDAIKARHPEFFYFTEGTRHQTPLFGYETAYEIVKDLGIGIYEVMNVNSWTVIDYHLNTALDPRSVIITDRSSVDNYGYYFAMRSCKEDYFVQRLLKNMVLHYVSLTDRFIFFPIGRFPLRADGMRSGDEEYQRAVHAGILEAFSELSVPQEKIHYLESVCIQDRVEEVLQFVGR